MSVIATVRTPTTDFPLGSSLELDPDETMIVESTVPTSEEVIPYLWIPEDAVDDDLEGIRTGEAVSSAAVIDEVGDYALVRLEWEPDVNGLFGSIRRTDAMVTRALGTAEEWTFTLRFPSYESLSRFYRTCVDRDVTIDVVRIHEVVSPESPSQFGLTDAQRELLLAAYEDGFFEVPRRTTLVELGEALGVSDSAVSQRLRRGLSTLLASTIAVDRNPTGSDGPG